MKNGYISGIMARTTRKTARAELYRAAWMGLTLEITVKSWGMEQACLRSRKKCRIVGNQDLFLSIEGSYPWV